MWRSMLLIFLSSFTLCAMETELLIGKEKKQSEEMVTAITKRSISQLPWHQQVRAFNNIVHHKKLPKDIQHHIYSYLPEYMTSDWSKSPFLLQAHTHKNNKIVALEMLYNGSLVSASCDGTVCVWDTEEYRRKIGLRMRDAVPFGIQRIIRMPAYAPLRSILPGKNSILVTGSQTVSLWNTDTGKQLRYGCDNGTIVTPARAYNEYVVFGSCCGEIKFWDAKVENNHNCIEIRPYYRNVQALTVIPDNMLAVLVNESTTVVLIDSSWQVQRTINITDSIPCFDSSMVSYTRVGQLPYEVELFFYNAEGSGTINTRTGQSHYTHEGNKIRTFKERGDLSVTSLGKMLSVCKGQTLHQVPLPWCVDVLTPLPDGQIAVADPQCVIHIMGSCNRYREEIDKLNTQLQGTSKPDTTDRKFAGFSRMLRMVQRNKSKEDEA